jgi:hypothetical protein
VHGAQGPPNTRVQHRLAASPAAGAGGSTPVSRMPSTTGVTPCPTGRSAWPARPTHTRAGQYQRCPPAGRRSWVTAAALWPYIREGDQPRAAPRGVGTPCIERRGAGGDEPLTITRPYL